MKCLCIEITPKSTVDKFKKWNFQSVRSVFNLSGVKSLFVILLAILQVGFANDKMTKIRFCPQYLPQAQFAGFYVAKEKGFYEKYNLDVEIKTYKTNGTVTEGLKSGDLDFGTFFLNSAIKLRSEGLPIVNIAQVSKQSALLLLTKKESNINKPEDMQGKKVGLYLDDFNIFYHAFFKKYDLDVEIVPIFSGIHLFLSGGVDMASFMWYNEYHTIMNSGYNKDELQPFFLKDYGFDVPEDGIYCTEETWKNHPDLCGDFVDATMEAWEYAFQHPDETLDIVMRYMKEAHVPGHVAHQQWMLNTVKKIIHPDNQEINTILTKKDFDKTIKLLSEGKSIDKTIKYEKFFKPVGKYAK